MNLILATYFILSDNKYETSQRKLYAYHFKRHVAGPNKGYYYHSLFTRDAPDLESISRKDVKPAASSSRAVNAQEAEAAPVAQVVADPEAAETAAAADDDGSSLGPLEDENGVTIPLYEVGTKVLARDADGLLYEAWIRRQLYGPHYHKQVQVGMINDQSEMEEYLEAAAQPSWHYFVHYNGWKVNWDRWVAESDVLPLNEKNSELAARITKAHRTLQQEFKASSARRKVDDAGAFLRAWKIRLGRLYEEESGVKQVNKESAASSPTVKKSAVWSKKSLEQEQKLRKQQLESAKSSSKPGTQKIVLPFSLKKVLVEEWEIISQCDMIHALPSQMTIRQALDQYLESKGVTRSALTPASSSGADVTAAGMQLDETAANGNVEGQTTKEISKTNGDLADTTKDPESVPMQIDQDEDMEKAKRDKEWIDMVDGIVMFFEQALPFRLLYPQELSQLAAIENDEQLSEKPKVEIYGCEHMLRLFLRLHLFLAQELGESLDEEEIKSILAKVNDLVRFLHKHQSTVFAQAFRKPNEAELKEQVKLDKAKERKRKRQLKLSAQQHGGTADEEVMDQPSAEGQSPEKRLKTNDDEPEQDPKSKIYQVVDL